jgi:26S proteasome regulatory subunit N1
MTFVSEENVSLKYRLTGRGDDIGDWGHEYIRHLSGEIAREFVKRQLDERAVDDL